MQQPGMQTMQTSPYGSPYPQRAPSTSSEDSGRGLEFFYARAGAGGAFVGLGALGGGDKLRLEDKSGVGGAFELALGVRLLVFTLGPRARLLLLAPATLWQVGAEAAFRVPLGRWDPFVGLQGGYTFGSSSNGNLVCANGAPASSCGATGSASWGGADVGLTGGADYYLSPNLSLGAAANVMFLFLSRKAVDGTVDPGLSSAASATGIGLTLGAHAGLHF